MNFIKSGKGKNNMNTKRIDELAQILWNFQKIDDELQKSDVIIAMGSHDLRVAERAAEIYLKGYAPALIMSGGFGRLTDKLWTVPEAEMFARRAEELGVARDHMLIEDASTNTGENIEFSKALLAKKGIHAESIILVHKPYMGKRAYACFKKIWPEAKLLVTSPQIPIDNYPNEHVPYEEMIHILVGDLQRIKEYPAKGFVIPLEIPDPVWSAYEELVAAGYTRHLIKK